MARATKLSEEHKRHIALGMLGKNKRPMTEETKRKLALAKIGKPMLSTRGENHHSWKGCEVGYFCLHAWVKKYKPNPGVCNLCGSNKNVRISNISGQYLRDLNDYDYLCVSCHNSRDKVRGESKFEELMSRVKHTGKKFGHKSAEVELEK